MFFYTLWNWIVGIIGFVALCYIVFRLFCRWQGDEKVIFLTNKRTPFRVEESSFQQVTLACEIPFRNVGKQNGTIMDCYPRHLLPYEQFNQVHVETWITDAGEPRPDGYWKAVIIEPNQGGKIILRVVLTALTGNIRKDAQDFPNMNIDIVYQMVGRTDWHIAKARVMLTREEVQRALEA